MAGTRAPEGALDYLEQVAPGPVLAAELAKVDRADLSRFDTVTLMKARQRLLAHEQAQFMLDMVAVTDAVMVEAPADEWVTQRDKYASAEVRAALAWTKSATDTAVGDALWLLERLRNVWNALDAGIIELAQARVFLQELSGLDDDVLARQIANQGIDYCRLRRTTGQLRAFLRKLVLTEDPQAAARRHKDAVKERRVVTGTNPDATAFLSGCNLPPDRAMAAYERIDAFARARKQAGDHEGLDQLRANVFLGLLDGTYAGPAPIHRRGVLEITVDLPTLLNLADNPGQLGGYGPVVADIARQVAAEQARERLTRWDYIVTDLITGLVRYSGTTRARPHAPGLSTESPSGRKQGLGARRFGSSIGTSEGPERNQTPLDGKGKDRRRFPTPPQRRTVVGRDRTCQAPGCRTPASRSEIDHVRDHADGGPTEEWNLVAACTYHHDLKDHGWSVHRDDWTAITTWTSPLGQIYQVKPEPLSEPYLPESPVERALIAQLRV
jgi:hypothetical protein